MTKITKYYNKNNKICTLTAFQLTPVISLAVYKNYNHLSLLISCQQGKNTKIHVINVCQINMNITILNRDCIL